MTLDGVTLTRDLIANAAGAVSVLSVLFAAPLLLGAYVVVQHRGPLTHFLWFGAVLALLAAALVAGALGLLFLG